MKPLILNILILSLTVTSAGFIAENSTLATKCTGSEIGYLSNEPNEPDAGYESAGCLSIYYEDDSNTPQAEAALIWEQTIVNLTEEPNTPQEPGYESISKL